MTINGEMLIFGTAHRNDSHRVIQMLLDIDQTDDPNTALAVGLTDVDRMTIGYWTDFNFDKPYGTQGALERLNCGPPVDG